MKRNLLLVAGVALLLSACGGKMPPASELIPPEGKYDVKILRDTFGVPHIYGKTDADVAYGLAYANSEDDFATMQEGLFLAKAKMGLLKGKEGAPFDFLVKAFRFREIVAEQYDKQLDAGTRAICDAYAEGYNHYAALNPGEVIAGVLPCTGEDVAAGFVIKAPFFFGVEGELKRLMGPERVTEVSQKQAKVWEGNALTGDLPMGSNTFAVSPKRSADGSTFLNVNSHQPYTGPVAWYEARLHSEEGWDMTGGVFPGAPVIFHGHNPNLGWAHTVNSPDLLDIYVLDINPGNENQYKFDGEWRDLEVQVNKLPVRLWGSFVWTVKKESYFSVYGPTVRTDHGTYAIRYAGYGSIGAVQQWYHMNKATSKDEFMDAMRERGVASFNTGYADKEGNIGYIYNALFPQRSEGYDWEKYLPGDTSDTLWTRYLPFDDMPMVWNPPSGFIENCNGSPFQTTTGPGNPNPDDFSKTLGIETHLTNREMRALELFGADESITWEDFHAYKFDTSYSKDSEAAKLGKQLLETEFPDDPVVREALEVMRAWDMNTDLENPNAAIAILTMEPIVRARIFGNPEPDPIETFVNRAHLLKDTFGSIAVPWKDVNKLVRGDKEWPLAGGPDTIRAVYGSWKDGRLVGEAGDCYFMLVKWDPDGKVYSESIHQFGSATLDAASPHYADQAELFARQEMKPTWLDEAELRQHLSEEYRPGDVRK